MRTHRSRLNIVFLVAIVLLSAASGYVVGKGAEDEPYVVVRRADAFVQVGVAMILMFVWLQLAAAVATAIVMRRISFWWSSLLLWIVVCEFYLVHSPLGYVEDVARLVAQLAKA